MKTKNYQIKVQENDQNDYNVYDAPNDNDCEPPQYEEDQQELNSIQYPVNRNLNEPNKIINRIQKTKRSYQSNIPEIMKKRKRNYSMQKKSNNCKQTIIILLLGLILGVSLFRVILQLQINQKVNINFEKEQKYKQQVSQHYQSVDQNAHGLQNRSNHPSLVVNKPHASNTASSIQPNPHCVIYKEALLKQKGSLYDFKTSREQIIIKSKVNYYSGQKVTQITKQQYSIAIDLLDLIHNVVQNGTLTLLEDPCQKIQLKKKRLQHAIHEQRRLWNQKYQMDSYFNNQLRFCIVVNSYKNAHNGLIYRNIDSILQQNYSNYHVAYTDDYSPDQTGIKVAKYLVDRKVPSDKFNLLLNQKKQGMMENIYRSIYQRCQDGEIVIMLDGDDSLIGKNTLSLINALYQKEKAALIWSNFIVVYANMQVSMGFSRAYSPAIIQAASFRKFKGFISSHLKTFFVDLFKKIKRQDLQQNNGQFYRGASDTVMMIPMLEMAAPKIKYLPQILYQYRYDTGQVGNSVNKEGQKVALKKLFQSSKYSQLEDFSFIDKAIMNTLAISK